MSEIFNPAPPSITNAYGRSWVLFSEPFSRLTNIEFQGASYFGYASYLNSGFIRSYVEVGRYCSLGRNVTLGLGSHNYSKVTTSPYFDKYCENNVDSLRLAQKSPKRRVIIGNDVWIGDNVAIASGVTLGTGSVVGANAVVTKSLPPYSISVGVPAKIIRYRFTSEVIERCIDSKWWEYHPLLLHDLFKTNDVADFLASIPPYLNKNLFPIKYTKHTPADSSM